MLKTSCLHRSLGQKFVKESSFSIGLPFGVIKNFGEQLCCLWGFGFDQGGGYLFSFTLRLQKRVINNVLARTRFRREFLKNYKLERALCKMAK